MHGGGKGAGGERAPSHTLFYYDCSSRTIYYDWSKSYSHTHMPTCSIATTTTTHNTFWMGKTIAPRAPWMNEWNDFAHTSHTYDAHTHDMCTDWWSSSSAVVCLSVCMPVAMVATNRVVAAHDVREHLRNRPFNRPRVFAKPHTTNATSRRTKPPPTFSDVLRCAPAIWMKIAIAFKARRDRASFARRLRTCLVFANKKCV